MLLVLIQHIVDDLLAPPAHEVVVAAAVAKEDFGAGEFAVVALGGRFRTFVAAKLHLILEVWHFRVGDRH